MSLKRIFLWLLACLLLLPAIQAIAGDFTFVYVPRGSARHLPACPADCEVRSFRRPGAFVGDITHKHAWSKLLRGGGARFPKGGFVVYERTTGIFHIASTPEDLEAITPLE